MPERRLKDKHLLAVSGERVDLVELAERHMPLVIAWRNNPDIRRGFFNQRAFTVASHAQWFDRYSADPNDYCFAITLKSGRTIGVISISQVDWRERSGQFGRFLIGDPLSRGRGLGREAARLVLEFARVQLRLNSLSLIALSDNAVALRLYRRLGFVEVATFTREITDGTMALACQMTLSLTDPSEHSCDRAPSLGSDARA